MNYFNFASILLYSFLLFAWNVSCTFTEIKSQKLESEDKIKGQPVASTRAFQTIGSVSKTITKTFFVELVGENDDILELNWLDALEYCQQRNTTLARIESSEENALATDVLNNVLHYSHFWLAGTDLQSEGRWYWFGDQRQITYSNWDSTEPDEGPENNCMTLYENGKWHSHYCTDTWTPLCQSVA